VGQGLAVDELTWLRDAIRRHVHCPQRRLFRPSRSDPEPAGPSKTLGRIRARR
jgi:hypothetical protein